MKTSKTNRFNAQSLRRGCMKTVGAALMWGSINSASAQNISTERVGVVGKELSSINISPDFDISKGRFLRMRQVTIAPGGVLPMHSHANRPSVSYVLKGALTEYVEGKAGMRVFTVGEAYATSGVNGHALLNKGSEPAVFLEIDLPE